MKEQIMQTTQASGEQSQQQVGEQQETNGPKLKQPRQLVRFTFYKLDPGWQLLQEEKRQQGKQELLAIFEEYSQGPLMRSFGLYGLRSDCQDSQWPDGI